MSENWRGVFPAVSTQFNADHRLDLEATIRHVERLIAAGVHGLIMLGSVGENPVLDGNERQAVIRATIEATGGRVPVIAGIVETSTPFACRAADQMASLGCDGVMVLPALLYAADARETVTHYQAVARAIALPIMCYNNPVAYGIDIYPATLAELAELPNIVAIKESSEDPRRISDIRNLCGDRFAVFCGADDLVLESAVLGAVGWVGGMINAFPADCVRLWNLAAEGRYDEALLLYQWLMPVFHLGMQVKFVQHIKLAQAICGLGGETVRPPRLTLTGEERARVAGVVQDTIDRRPMVED